MYADPTARGGVLEPEGMVEIKFRSSDLIAAMHRLDQGIAALKASNDPNTAKAIKKREADLLPVYRQASSHLVYCDVKKNLPTVRHKNPSGKVEGTFAALHFSQEGKRCLHSLPIIFLRAPAKSLCKVLQVG